MNRVNPLLAGLALTLVGCGSPLTSSAGLEMIKGGHPPLPTVNAARVHHQATLVHGGKTLRFQIWTVADSVSGRLEASGPLGIGLATVVWDDTSWQASLPGQSTLLRGRERSLNLPVLNLRDVSPSRLLSPYLGRGWTGQGPFRAIPAEKNQTLLLAQEASPSWSLLLDNRTGLPLRRQTLAQGKETEAITFLDWQAQGNLLVPGRLIRTNTEGQRLELELKDWSPLEALPAGCLNLKVPAGTDTIVVGTGENGRKFYQIHTPASDPTSHQPAPTDDPDAETDGEWEDDSSSEPLAPAGDEPSPTAKQRPGNP